VLDVGLLHTFNGDERRRYVESLASVMKPGATLYVLCFSDKGADVGPHPVSDAELRDAFGVGGWDLLSIEPERVGTRFHDAGAPAWLATVNRDGSRHSSKVC